VRSLHIFHHSNLNNGVDRTCFTLVSAMRDLGHEVHVIVPGEGALTNALASKGFSWKVMPLGCCTGSAWKAQLRFLSNAGVRAKQLEDLLRKENFDVVHLNTGHLFDAALAAARVGVPAIWHIHSPFEIDYERYKRFVGTEGYAWILEALGSQIIAVSEDIRTSLTRYLPHERIHTVYNGIDLEDLTQRAEENRGDIRRELGLEENSRIVLGVGRISDQKDFATFARVAERVVSQDGNVYFAIAGPAQDRRLAEALESRVQTPTLKGRVFLLGPRSDIPRLMDQSDAFLSTAIYEGHPLTTIEAMALQLPVVAMACVGLRECIQDGVDGLLVPLGDVEAAAAAVLQVLGNADLAEKLGRAARQIVSERFSCRSYALEFLKVAQKAIKYGPSRVAHGSIDLVQGLLGQLGRATHLIGELEAERGICARTRRLAQRTLRPIRHFVESLKHTIFHVG